MDNHLDILHKLALDKGINRRERDMLIALKAFDFENSNVISVGLQTLLDYFCIKNKECIYSVLRTLQSKNYIRIEKKNGIKNVYVIIKDYLLGKESFELSFSPPSAARRRCHHLPHLLTSRCRDGWPLRSCQVPEIPGFRGLIDKDTPAAALTCTGFDGKDYQLVFSDEFEEEGRQFEPGMDPYWEAMVYQT